MGYFILGLFIAGVVIAVVYGKNKKSNSNQGVGGGGAPDLPEKQ